MHRLLCSVAAFVLLGGAGCADSTPSPAPSSTSSPAERSAAAPDRPAAEGPGDADVVRAVATPGDDGTWSFAVTVRHADTGWEDYADGWDVVLPDGAVVKRAAGDAFTRVLGHPHVNEQPFTRSQSGLVIPADVTRVTVRAHERRDGYGGQVVTLTLPPR